MQRIGGPAQAVTIGELMVVLLLVCTEGGAGAGSVVAVAPAR